MKKNQKQKKHLNDGFTFAETLVVLAVTALLAGQVTASAFGMLQKGRVISARSEIEQLKIALQSYYIDEGRFPTTQEGLEVLWEKGEFRDDRWNGPYIDKKRPVDPWGNNYLYFDSKDAEFLNYAAEGIPFAVISYGSDGVEGGSGSGQDICSWE